MQLKKHKARRLYVNQLYLSKEVAKAVNVAPNTLGAWVKDGNWKQAREEFIAKNAALPAKPELLIGDLLEFIKEKAPHLAAKVEPIINEYTKLIQII